MPLSSPGHPATKTYAVERQKAKTFGLESKVALLNFQGVGLGFQGVRFGTRIRMGAAASLQTQCDDQGVCHV